MGVESTGVVTLARFGLTTGFLLGPADDRRCRLVFSLRSRFSQWLTCAVNIQGVHGEGTLVSWFGVFLVMVTRMDVLMCFRADILLVIPRVYISK